MPDVFSLSKRSEIMSSIGQRNTKPEIIVRKLLHRMGYRFRLHRRDLPGKPDIVLPKYRTVIFVHGCFWHGHLECSRAKLPETNKEFWEKKTEKNRQRDRSNIEDLTRLKWRVITVWQCELKDMKKLHDRIQHTLSR
jgi:DNA mismatch endonuclease, patch repair protein